MSSIVNALKKAHQAHYENNTQPAGQEAVSPKQALPVKEQGNNPQFMHLVQLNVFLCSVLVVMIGVGLWINFKVSSGMAVAKNNMAIVAAEIKEQSEELSQLNDTIARLAKINESQKKDTQERLVKLSDALQKEFDKQKQSLVKTIEKQDETISKLTMSQDQLRTLFRDYKMMNHDLSKQVDVLQQKISSFTTGQ